MSDFVRVDQSTVENLTPAAAEVIAHLCEGDCLTFGSVLSWCESRNDCVHVVTCPSCGTQYRLDDDDLCALERWTEQHGDALVCGVKDIA